MGEKREEEKRWEALEIALKKGSVGGATVRKHSADGGNGRCRQGEGQHHAKTW